MEDRERLEHRRQRWWPGRQVVAQVARPEPEQVHDRVALVAQRVDEHERGPGPVCRVQEALALRPGEMPIAREEARLRPAVQARVGREHGGQERGPRSRDADDEDGCSVSHRPRDQGPAGPRASRRRLGGEEVQQARHDALAAIGGVASHQAQPPHPDDRAALEPPGQHQQAEAGDPDDPLASWPIAVGVELADDTEEDQGFLKVQLLDAGRDGPADGHARGGQAQQHAVVPGAQGVTGGHDGQPSRRRGRRAVAVLLEDVAQVQGRVVLDVRRHLLLPAAGMRGVDGPGGIALPPLVGRRHAGRRATIVAHGGLVGLADERADAPQLALRSSATRSS